MRIKKFLVWIIVGGMLNLLQDEIDVCGLGEAHVVVVAAIAERIAYFLRRLTGQM